MCRPADGLEHNPGLLNAVVLNIKLMRKLLPDTAIVQPPARAGIDVGSVLALEGREVPAAWPDAGEPPLVRTSSRPEGSLTLRLPLGLRRRRAICNLPTSRRHARAGGLADLRLSLVWGRGRS